MPSLSIVHVDTAAAFRGGQQALLTLACALRVRGHVQQIVTPADSALARRACAAGFPVSPLGSVHKLRQYVQEAQIVHTHSGRAQTLAFFATARLNALRVTTRHVAFEPRHPAVHRLKYTLTCHGVIAVSEGVRRILLSAGVPAEKITVIFNGVEPPAAAVTPGRRSAARAKYGLTDEHFVVGHLGAFTSEKGQDVAAQAASLLEQRLPGLRMVLGGEGPLRIAPTSRVLIPGFITDRDEFFAALDLFVMPSRSEGWGIAAAEALAHGVPVAASDTGGLGEIVDAGQTGWLLPPGDAEALAAAICEAASHPDRLRAMSARARERARRFSIEQTAAQTERLYRRLLDEAR